MKFLAEIVAVLLILGLTGIAQASDANCVPKHGEVSRYCMCIGPTACDLERYDGKTYNGKQMWWFAMHFPNGSDGIYKFLSLNDCQRDLDVEKDGLCSGR